MKVFLDTSIIVQIDRKNQDTINIMKKLVGENHDILISMVTVSEILTGSYLRKDFRKSVLEAKKILSQFLWVELDSQIAEKTAKYLAYLISEGKPIEYQDVVIAASCSINNADYLLTLNKSHFSRFPDIKDKVRTVEEFKKIM